MMYPMSMKVMSCPRPRMMPSLLDDPFFRSMMGEAPRRPRGMRVDVQENENEYILEAVLPGVKPEQISLTVQDDVLTIAADVNRRMGEERRSVHVERRFTLEGIAQEEITAASADGILTVTLPKVKPAPAEEPRRIAISTKAAQPVAALPEGEAVRVGSGPEA